MRARSVLAAITLAAAGVAAVALLPHAETAHAESRAAMTSGPTVALLATHPTSAYTSFYLARAGESAPSVPVATFPHLEGALVRAAVIPGTASVLATADTLEARDASFNASLFRVDPHQGSVRLCDQVVHGSRPLITSAGRVFVARGADGQDLGGQMRVDALTIDEIDPVTGEGRTVHSYAGYLTFLAGAIDRDLLVYRVGPGGADLVRVDADTGHVRPVLSSMLPFARDFSVDPALSLAVFQERDEADSHLWVVDRVDLTTGARSRLATGPSPTLSPYALADGRVLYNPDSGGLHVFGERAEIAPLGAGADVVQAEQDGWIAVLHTVAGELPGVFAVEVATGKAAALAAPPGTRVVVAGFVPAGGAP